MADTGTKYTDKQIKKVEKRLTEVYGEAAKDIDAKMQDFNNRHRAKYAIHLQELKDGKITQDQFDSWVQGQIFQGKQWQAKKEQIEQVLYNANSVAMKIVNGETSGVFAYNANFMSYELEHGAGVDFGFGLYDTATVSNLIKNEPDLLPQPKVKKAKDMAWNSKKITRQITQGIIQGESLDKIAKRLSNVTSSQNMNAMLTHARTAMTGAQNTGRVLSLQNAKSKGIDVVKEWVATLDERTRTSHAEIDGEKQKVGDKWHPMKFSNGCRYPGDPEGAPAEVYNCRCTLVGDVEEYPDEFQRYDNIDGKPIKNMTYKEWYKTKFGKYPVKKPVKPKIDYSKYGGKEVFDILKKYKDTDDMIDNATNEEWKHINSLINSKGIDSHDLDKLMQEAKNGGATKTATNSAEEKATKEAEKKYEKAKADLAKIEQEIKDKEADKTFSGIWQKPVTYADWEDKKDSIAAKKDYYNGKIALYKKNFYDQIVPDDEAGKELYDLLSKHSGHKLQAWEDDEIRHMIEDVLDLDEDDFDDIWTMYVGAEHNIKEATKFLDELGEFEKYGEEYSKLLAERQQAKNLVTSLKPKPLASEVFSEEAYSQARKDAAIWAKSRKEADDILRQGTKDVWATANKEEKYAAWDYTAGSGKFNRPTRGYGDSWYDFKGIGNVPLDNEGAKKEIEALTDLIERSTLQQDTWLQRGVESLEGLSNFVDVPVDVLRNATQEELEQLLLNKQISDAGFMSCGSSKGSGFSGSILNIYCPEGTQAIYVEPFSYYGHGAKSANWDGVSDQSYFGSELETLLQRNSDFVIAKVEKDRYGQIYIDIDLVGQDPHRYDNVYK